MKHQRILAQPAGPSVIFLGLLSLGLTLFTGCGAPKPRFAEPEALPSHLVPSRLHATHLEHGISLSWQTNRRPGDAISGYQIYIAPEKSIRRFSPDSPEGRQYLWQSVTYPGDTDPRTDIETAVIDGVEYGVLYYIHVRTVSADGVVGPPSEEITVIPRPAGRIRMVPRHVGDGDGYSFAGQEYVRCRDEKNDLYTFVRNDSVFAASPHRLDQYQRQAEFHEIGPSKAVEDYPVVEIAGKGKTIIHLRQGITYVLSTQENCLAKFRVAAIEGTDNGTIVTLDYVYQPRCGQGIF